PRRRADAGGPRTTGGYRWRVPPGILAYGLPLSGWRRAAGAGKPHNQVPQREGRDRIYAGRTASNRETQARQEHICRALQFLEISHTRNSEAQYSFTEHDALSRRPRGDR